MAKRKSTNNDLKTLHRKLKIEHHEPHSKPEMNSGEVYIESYVSL